MKEFFIKQDRKHKKLNRHWQYCICGCHASLALRADYLRQLKKMHDELGIQYVRFHAIFHDDMQVMMKFSDLMPLPGAEKLNQVSFRKIGMVYDNVLACGMKPYVELSFMPKHLAAADAKCGFFYGGWISPPKDEGEWCDFISTDQYAGDPIGGVDATEDLEAEGNAEAESRKPEMLVHLFDGMERKRHFFLLYQ